MCQRFAIRMGGWLRTMTVFMYTTNSADGRALDPSPDIATCHVPTHHPGLAPQKYQKRCFCRLLTKFYSSNAFLRGTRRTTATATRPTSPRAQSARAVCCFTDREYLRGLSNSLSPQFLIALKPSLRPYSFFVSGGALNSATVIRCRQARESDAPPAATSTTMMTTTGSAAFLASFQSCGTRSPRSRASQASVGERNSPPRPRPAPRASPLPAAS